MYHVIRRSDTVPKCIEICLLRCVMSDWKYSQGIVGNPYLSTAAWSKDCCRRLQEAAAEHDHCRWN